MHQISVVKGMLMKGQCFLSTPLKKQAMAMLDDASNYFTESQLQHEALRASRAQCEGMVRVLESERDSLKAEIDTLRQALEATHVAPTDTAQLVPVDGATVLVVPDMVGVPTE